MNKIRVLFLCVHNSARSQMAEAWLRNLDPVHYEAESAGLEPGVLNPLAVQAMNEAGIDISKHAVKDVFEMHRQGKNFHYVVTVCDPEASDRCPVFPGLHKKINWSFEDPSGFAGPVQEKLDKTRAVRDRIQAAVQQFILDTSATKQP